MNNKRNQTAIKIANIDVSTIEKIDMLAKKQNLSRSSFLKNLLEDYLALSDFKKYEDRYALLIEKIGIVIENNTHTLKELIDLFGEET